MNIPDSGGLSQSLVGRIRLNVDQLKRDAMQMANASREAAGGIAKGFNTAAVSVDKSTKQILVSTERLASSIALDTVKASNRMAVENQKNANRIVAENTRAQNKMTAEAQKAALKREQIEIVASNRLTQEIVKGEQRRYTEFVKSNERVQQEVRRSADRRAVEEQRASYKTADRSLVASQRVELENQKAINKIAVDNNRSILRQTEAAKRLETQLKRVKPPTPAFETFNKALGEARISMLSVVAAGAGLLYFGVKAADDAQILTTRYRELAGSQERAAELMNRVAVSARKMNLPIRQTQKDFLGLIPAVQEAGGNLEEYTNVAIRLATLNSDSRGGVEGAIYAIREALSSGGTDLVSLSERFNIPRRTLRTLIKETGSLSAALDIVLNRYGATTEAAKAQSRSLTVLSAQIRDTAQRALERTFAGALEITRNALVTINDLLEKIPQPLLDIAAYSILAVSAISALTLGVGALGGAFTTTFKVATTFATFLKGAFVQSTAAATAASAGLSGAAGLGAVAGKAGAIGLSVAGGAAVGIEISRAIGRNNGDETLANADGNLLGDYLKQLVYVIYAGLLKMLEPFARAVSDVVNFFNSLGTSLNIFAKRLEVAFYDIALGIQKFLESIGRGNADEIKRLERLRGGGKVTLTTGLFDSRSEQEVLREYAATLEDGAAKDIVNSIARSYDTIVDALDKGILELKNGDSATQTSVGVTTSGAIGEIIHMENELTNVRIDSYESIRKGMDDSLRSFAVTLFPELRQQALVTRNVIQEYFDSLNDAILKRRSEIGDQIAGRFDSDVSFLSELADLIENGDTDAVGNRIDGLNRERDAILKLIPELEKYADDSVEAADKLAEANKRLLEISVTIPKFMDALAAATQRALAKAQDEFTEEITKAAEKRDTDLLKIAEDTADAMRDLRDDVADKRAELVDKEKEIQDQFIEASIDAQNKYYARLAEIERNFFRAVTLAASQLDAAGVAAAINARNDELRKANEDFSGNRADNDKKRQEQQDALNKELADLNAYYTERREEIFAKNREETNDVLAEYDKQFALADAARLKERTAALLFYDLRMQDLVTAGNSERAIRQQMLGQFVQDTFAKLSPLLSFSNLFLGGNQTDNPVGTATSNVIGSVLGASAGALLNQTGSVLGSLLAPVFNINGVTDPALVAEMVRQEVVDLAAGR